MPDIDLWELIFMYENKSSKIVKSLTAGFCAAVILAAAAGRQAPKQENLSLFFPGFILGAAIERDSGECEDREDVTIEFGFRIAEIFRSIFS